MQWRTQGCNSVLPQDPGSGRRRRTSTGTAVLLPSPAVGAEVDTQADLQPFSVSLQPPCPPLSLSNCSFSSSSLSAFLTVLAPCTGQDHNGPEWLMVTVVQAALSHARFSAALLYLCPLWYNTVLRDDVSCTVAAAAAASWTLLVHSGGSQPCS